MVKQLCDAGTVVCWELCRGQIFNFLACCIRDVDMEKYARNLPRHLIAVIMDWEMDKSTFKYLLCGILLLHSMIHLASRVPKIEQVIGSQTILLDDVKISEQLIDLVFYLLVLLGPYRHVSIHFLESLDLSSVVCRYVLTTSYPGISHHTQWHGSSSFGSGSLYYKIVSPHYQEVAQALNAYYKVDIFIEAEFAAVCVDVKFLQTNDSSGSAFPTTEETLNHLCQSVILLFNFYSPCLLHLCEAESVSYLEEVASKTSTQDVAKSVGLKVLALLKKCLMLPLRQATRRGNWNLMQCAWQMSCQMIQIFCHSS
ncbi:hypothetical protein SASPL_154307 [Salvia splendens]|uniref:Nodulin homeobox N-terminal domain-containing protein n=1 Tax=Salvia splendens TaxID=180675 RepID=A0A8X8YZQ3_SALSN|nr:hypothetical protein SASPL_154307 [Salvia splendens]